MNLNNNNSSNHNKKYPHEESRDSFIHQVVFKYLPYWPLFLLLMIICSVGAWLYMRYTIPVYETTATVLIKDEKKGIDESKLLEQLNLFGSKKIVENEIEILHSRTLMKEVIENLGLYAPVYREGRIVDIPAYMMTPVDIEMRNPDSLVEAKKVYFNYDSSKGQVLVNGKAYALNEWMNSPWGQIRFKRNPRYIKEEGRNRFYFSLIGERVVEKDLLENLKVEATSKTSTVIRLRLHDAIPERGEAIMNELLKAYSRASIEDKNRFAANTMSFIEDRLRLVVKELESVESSIQSFKSEKGIVDIGEQGKIFLGNVSVNDQKISEINVQLSMLDEVDNYVRNKQGNNSAIVPSTLGISDPTLNNLLKELYDSESQYEKLKKTTAENNPILVSIRNASDKIRPSLLENIENTRRNLEAAKRDLNAVSGRYISALRTIPSNEKQLLEISREQSIKNNIYTFLLQKREETALSYASTVADSRQVDPGQSSIEPTFPRKRLIYSLGILASLALGIAIVSIREALNRNILYRQEIEALTPFPIVGEISYNKSKEPIVITGKRRDFIAEQFRQLRTSLSYLGLNQDRKRILVTSSVPGEGKSFVSANLAMSLALADKKVALLSLDLRKPKIHEAFNLDNQVGITDYLIGKKEPDEVIKPSEMNENLFILTSGPIPPNPSELIMNGRIQKLLSYLNASFDYIIIDAPPVNPVTDAYILLNYCDTILYVVRHGVTPKGYIKLLQENARIRGIKNLSIIFNGVKNRGVGEYGYGGYGYDHDYGYNLDAEDTPKRKIRFLKKT